MSLRRGRAVALGTAVAAVALSAAHGAPGASAPLWIVFSAQPNGLGAPQLFRVQTTGAGLEQITTGAQPATDPAFSPDGTRVVFARLSSGIFRVNLDGSGLHRLTSGSRDTYPVWSPDGRHIAFIRIYKTQWRLYVMSASGAGQTRLRLAPPAGRPTWTRDSKSILIPDSGSVTKVDARTGRVQTRYRAEIDPVDSQAATVSPDITRVAFVGTRPPTGPPDCGESHCPAFALYVSKLSGKRQKITNDTGPAGWSPDSKTIVFVARGVLTLNVIGGGKTTIHAGPHVPSGDAPPAWQPR